METTSRLRALRNSPRTARSPKRRKVSSPSLTLAEKEEEKAEKGEKQEENEQKEEPKQESKATDQINNFFFDPEGDPRFENWILALIIAIAANFLVSSAAKKPLDEIIYVDFLNNYLLQGKVKEIQITKDLRTEVFNYRAEIEMLDGKKFYMVLGSQESFLAKLDMVQRQMGKQPNEFIPVKYVNDSQLSNSHIMFNFVMMAITAVAFYSLYKRGRIGGTKPGQKKGQAKKNDSGGWFGSNMGGIDKSSATTYGEDKKIDIRFKDVAGHENAK